jgi:hypothetical protein
MRVSRSWIRHALASAACPTAILCGCGSHDRLGANATNSTASRLPASRTASAPTTKQNWQSVEVRYGGHLNPQALSPAQKEAIVGCAMDAAPPGSRIWFILVLYNKNKDYTTRVYFEPTVTASRVRKGVYAYITPWAQRVRGNSELASAIRAHRRPLPDYIQISDEAAPFAKILNIPRLDRMPFDPNGAPFGKSAKLSDEEWVALADLVRPLFESHKGGPICRVESAEGVLRVYSGWQEGPLAGGGCLVSVKRKPGGGFELVGNGVGIWMS